MYKSTHFKGKRHSSHKGRPPFKSRFRGGRNRKGPGPGLAVHEISAFIKRAEANPKPKVDAVATRSFADFNFQPIVARNIALRNFTHPTPVQDQAIPVIREGKDIVGLANTGTGKTGAFLLPLIEKVYANRKEKVLIIAPTRELALQIHSELIEFSRGMNIHSAVCVGGVPLYRQIRELKYNPLFLIGTPGRLKDVNDRKLVSFSEFTNVVLDEVDRMLDMGFIGDIKEIIGQLPKHRQSLFFSATMPPKIRDLAHAFLKHPVTVDVQHGDTAHNVAQEIIKVTDDEMKFRELQNLLRSSGAGKTLIFSETKRSVDRLAAELVKEGFKAHSLHGDKRQRERERVIQNFRNNAFTILVATDVAARGLDVKDITHVINYTIPQTHDAYVHRIGRTGRGGSVGRAVTFV